MKKQSSNSHQIIPPKVAIAGGGWAGIAAAIRLAEEKIPVVLLEAEKQLGGRARCARFGNLRVDNGQHLIFGHYRYLLELIEKIKLPTERFAVQKNFKLAIRNSSRSGFQIRARRIFAPWHLVLGLLTAKGLSWKDKARIAAFWNRIASAFDEDLDDVPLLQLLQETRQPEQLITRFWKPLCSHFLHAPVETASAKLFATLCKTLMHLRSNSQLLFPKGDLATLIGEPAIDFIETHKGKISLNQTITRLNIKDGHVVGVSTETDRIPCKHLILALPYKTCASLFLEHPVLAETSYRLDRLRSTPMTTVYLQYPGKARISGGLKGSATGIFNWFYDRRFCGQPNLIAAVSHDRQHLPYMHNDEISRLCMEETARLFRGWPKPSSLLAIHEPEANLCCTVDIEHNRPSNRTAVPNCYIAGDYTDTGLPGTLESAVKSGMLCAEEVIRNYREQE